MSNASSDKSGCLGLLFQIFGIAPSTSVTGPLPFHLRDDFLSPAEISFYHILLSAAGDRFTVCPKVNLNDIFLFLALTRIKPHGHWFNKFGLRVIFGDASSRRRRSALARRRLPFLLVGFCFLQRLVLLSVRATAVAAAI
jgi:hypothetical protein